MGSLKILSNENYDFVLHKDYHQFSNFYTHTSGGFEVFVEQIYLMKTNLQTDR